MSDFLSSSSQHQSLLTSLSDGTVSQDTIVPDSMELAIEDGAGLSGYSADNEASSASGSSNNLASHSSARTNTAIISSGSINNTAVTDVISDADNGVAVPQIMGIEAGPVIEADGGQEDAEVEEGFGDNEDLDLGYVADMDDDDAESAVSSDDEYKEDPIDLRQHRCYPFRQAGSLGA